MVRIVNDNPYTASKINMDRARWAAIALDAFAKATGQDLRVEADDVIGDLLCDLQHLCVIRGFDYEMLAARGCEHFDEEAMGLEGG